MDKSKLNQITQHLIYKDNAYWLTCTVHYEVDGELQEGLDIVPEDWGLNNGFDSAADAFSYLSSLSNPDKEGE